MKSLTKAKTIMKMILRMIISMSKICKNRLLKNMLNRGKKCSVHLEKIQKKEHQ